MTAMRVAVLGLWHQGVVAAACFADLGYEVVATDASPAVVTGLQGGKLPVFEPGLEDLVGKGLASGKLHFVQGFAAAARDADIVCVMIDTPVDENDVSDLSSIFDAAHDIAPVLKNKTVVYVTSQIPIGTCAKIQEILDAGAGRKIAIGYSPENLRLGIALQRFLHPPLPVIGTDDVSTFETLVAFLSPLTKEWQNCGIATAEMLKHALNGFLAVNICFGNEIGNLCDAVGADGGALAKLLRLEPRVGPNAMLTPGLGFAGGTLARDMMTLRTIGDRYGIETLLLDGAWNTNKGQNKLVVHRLGELLGNLAGKRICVLGLTYKADTSTLRRSAALEVIEDLHAAGAKVHANDPGADREELTKLDTFEFVEDVYEAAEGADAVILMTPWHFYKEIDLKRLHSVMRGDVLFDTARLWSAEAAAGLGFTYIDIGGGRAAKSTRSY